jgi:hypothetical protein
MPAKIWPRRGGTSAAHCPRPAAPPMAVPGRSSDASTSEASPETSDPVLLEEASDQNLLAGLNDRLIRVLAGLHGAPGAVAEATIQLLPFGSRAGLEAAELATLERDESGQEFLRLTPAAYAAMAQAAAKADGTADAVVEWERRLERAHRANISRARC